jgi:tetratricopeptide (TPR) repeat protein
MWLQPFTMIAVGLLGAPAAQPAEAPSWVLSPASGSQVAACMNVETAIAGSLHFSAAIEGKGVEVTTTGEPRLAFRVSLIHPSAATASADRLAGVAVVRHPPTGPQVDRVYRDLVARLRRCATPIVWTKLQANPPPPEPPEVAAPGVGIDAIHAQLERVRNRISIDRSEEARVILEGLPSDLSHEAAIEVALAWRLAGDPSAAARIVEALGSLRPPLDAFAAVVRGDAETVDKALAEHGADAACAYAHVAEIHTRLGDHRLAIATAERVRTLDPTCVRAWEIEVSQRALHGDADKAIEVGDAAVRVHPQNAGLLSAVASARLQSGRVDAAIALLERVARRANRPSGVLRVLLGAMVREPDRRAQSRRRLEARLASGEADTVDRFLLGVVRHYENDFPGSNALLTPLEEELGHEDRLQIYRAMNDFNLGDRDGAMARLEAAEKRNDPDPDIYYCLAELLRDTDRPRALASLERYAAASHADPMSNPSKEARIARLVTDLGACIVTGQTTCEGEWEHPRDRHAGEEDDQRRRAWLMGGFVILAFGLAIVIRRRRRRHEASS